LTAQGDQVLYRDTPPGEMIVNSLLLAAAFLVAQPPPAVPLYRVELLRAAPGRLLELIAVVQDRNRALADATGDPLATIARHSQGDQWDLMVIHPVESMSAYYAAGKHERREDVASRFRDRTGALVSWREDTFFAGPPSDEFASRMGDGSFIHVEMFVALAGKREELRHERDMENEYLRGIGRPENLVFVRVLGGAWDAMTIGIYRGLKHYAESADVSEARQDASAKAAGFESVKAISPYLRSLIAWHHDTLATLVSPEG
jgi:hypothetical protein